MTQVSRLKVGVDVPWVTSWSEEVFLGVGPCASVGGRLAIGQQERPGIGRPQYSRNHMRRQRESVARMLCPMCGEPTAADDRWVQTASRVRAGDLRRKGFDAVLPRDIPHGRVLVNAGAIAPSHLACARRALEHCPHLAAHPDREIFRFPDRWLVFPLFVEAKPHAAALQRQPASTAVISFLQLCGIPAPDRRSRV